MDHVFCLLNLKIIKINNIYHLKIRISDGMGNTHAHKYNDLILFDKYMYVIIMNI